MAKPDPPLGDLLKAAADQYEPNHERIMYRIRTQDPGPLHRFEPRRRHGWMIPAVAASLVALIAGVITVVDRLDRAPAAARVAVASQNSPSTGATAGSEPTKSRSAPGPSVVPELGSAVSSAPSRRTTTGPGTPSATSSQAESSAATLQVDIASAAAGTQVVLPGGAIDWIESGSGPNGEAVRSAKGNQLLSGPHLTGTPTETPAASPFSVSWTDGMPSGGTARSSHWLSVTGPAEGPITGFLVAAPASGRQAQLVLYVGARTKDGELLLRLGHSQLAKTLKASQTGYVLTIRFSTHGSADTLSAQLNAGLGGSVALAAAVLR